MRSLRLMFALSLLAFAGCKQGEGERCQVTADCDDGLKCSFAGSAGGSQMLGFCRPIVDDDTPDANTAPPPDANTTPTPDGAAVTIDAASPTIDAAPPAIDAAP